MNHVPFGFRCAFLLGLVGAVCLLAGCGSGGGGGQAESISPEMQKQVDETIYKNYAKDYRSMYGKSKKGQ
jgi:hypothetical protein